jgi:hypothetical protein
MFASANDTPDFPHPQKAVPWRLLARGQGHGHPPPQPVSGDARVGAGGEARRQQVDSEATLARFVANTRYDLYRGRESCR